MAHAHGVHIQNVASVALQHQRASQPCTPNAAIGAPHAERAAYIKPESVSKQQRSPASSNWSTQVGSPCGWSRPLSHGPIWKKWAVAPLAGPSRHHLQAEMQDGRPDCPATLTRKRKSKNVNELDWRTSPKADGAVLLPPLALARADLVPLLAHLLVQLRGLQDADEHEHKATPGAKDLHRPACALRRKRGELGTVAVA